MSGRVLVLNDDPDAGELIARLVETTGVDAERCTDPGQVLGLLKDGSRWIGAVLDLQGGTAASLPVLNDIRQAEDPIGSIAVLVLTSTADSELFAWQSGADGFLQRPFHADDLVTALGAALGRSASERDAYRRDRVSGAQPA